MKTNEMKNNGKNSLVYLKKGTKEKLKKFSRETGVTMSFAVSKGLELFYKQFNKG